MHLQLSSTKRLLVGCALFVALLPVRALFDIDLAERRMAGVSSTEKQRYCLPPKEVLRGLSFGYNELVADLLWVRTIAYFADHLTTDHDLRYLERHLKNLVALDPHFKEVYRYGASMLMSRGVRQTNADVFAAIQLIEQAHRLFPDDWHFPLQIGTYYLGELRTPSKTEREKWRRTGADWVRRAALIGADAPWLPSLAANVYTEQGQRELAIRHLKELYLTAQSEDMRQQIAVKLQTLEQAHLAAELAKEARQFAAARKRAGLAFVPDDLFVLLRQPPWTPFSLAPPAPGQHPE